MSICDDVQRIVTQNGEIRLDEKICEMYEEADKSFQELVEQGIAFKRGYQLLPIENTISKSANFNVARN